MKKALLVFALVAFLATGTVFAELTGVGEPTVSGSVSTTFGYDLDTEASGIVNDSSLTLTLPLLDGSMTKGGDDGMYGEITVEDIGWQLTNDGFYDVDEDADATTTDELVASISAKLVINDLFVKLGEPDFAMNNVDVSTDYGVDANAYEEDVHQEWTGGFSAGFMNDLVTIEFMLASEDDYRGPSDDDVEDTDTYTGPFDNDTDDETDAADVTTYTANVDNDYVFGAALTLAPAEGISIPLTFSYDAASSGVPEDLMAFGAAPSVEMAPLTLSLPIDYVSFGDQYGFEVAPSLQYDLITDGSNVTVDFLYGTYEETVTGGAIGDLSIAFTETEEDGFVPALAAMVEFSAVDMLDYEDDGSDMGWGVDAEASYNMNGLKPYINGGYGSDEVVDMGVGVEMAAAFTGFDNTVFTLDYTNEALTESEDGTTETESGRVTFDVTVSF